MVIPKIKQKIEARENGPYVVSNVNDLKTSRWEQIKPPKRWFSAAVVNLVQNLIVMVLMPKSILKGEFHQSIALIINNITARPTQKLNKCFNKRRQHTI